MFWIPPRIYTGCTMQEKVQKANNIILHYLRHVWSPHFRSKFLHLNDMLVTPTRTTIKREILATFKFLAILQNYVFSPIQKRIGYAIFIAFIWQFSFFPLKYVVWKFPIFNLQTTWELFEDVSFSKTNGPFNT